MIVTSTIKLCWEFPMNYQSCCEISQQTYEAQHRQQLLAATSLLHSPLFYLAAVVGAQVQLLLLV